MNGVADGYHVRWILLTLCAGNARFSSTHVKRIRCCRKVSGLLGTYGSVHLGMGYGWDVSITLWPP